MVWILCIMGLIGRGNLCFCIVAESSTTRTSLGPSPQKFTLDFSPKIVRCNSTLKMSTFVFTSKKTLKSNTNCFCFFKDTLIYSRIATCFFISHNNPLSSPVFVLCGVFLLDEPKNSYNYRSLYFTVEKYTFLTTEKIAKFGREKWGKLLLHFEVWR